MVLESIWKEFLNIVRQEKGSRVVETWFKAVSIHHWDDAKKIMYIQAPNKFVKDWISNNYTKIFEENLQRLLHESDVSIQYIDTYPELKSGELVELDEQEETSTKNSAIVSHKNRFKNSVPILPARKINGFINDYYTFENFIVGPNNSMAYAAARAVAEKPGKLYNPLFIYGGSGLGKTHLLNAIGNAVREAHKDFWVLYQPADHFVNDFISAIRFDKIHLFQEKYKEVDLLLIDDIQFMANKDHTQETFFHIFNFLYESGKQIVFSSDVYPSDINGMAKRLKSRFESGLIADVKKPSLETKVAILKRKSEVQKQHVSDDVIFYIASKFNGSIRELDGALVRVIAYANLAGEQISLDLAKKVLFRTQTTREDFITLDLVAHAVCKKYSYSLEDLRSVKKTKELSMARQVAMYLMKNLTDRSLRDIGEFLCKKDHTTVLHGLHKIEQLREIDHDLDLMLKHIEEDIHNTPIN